MDFTRNVKKFMHRTDTKKMVVYTCITGNYDVLPKHTYINTNYDYICFTDNKNLLKKKKSGAWQIKPLAFTELDQIKNSRWHKVHPHLLFPNYDFSIWVDGKVNIKTSYLFSLCPTKFKISLHPNRNCIYKECIAVDCYQKDIADNIERIYQLLISNNFPRDYGLHDTCIILRNHNNKEIINIMNDWWKMIEVYSRRDQLSLSYILWKHGIQVQDISFPSMVLDNANFGLFRHKQKKNLKSVVKMFIPPVVLLLLRKIYNIICHKQQKKTNN